MKLFIPLALLFSVSGLAAEPGSAEWMAEPAVLTNADVLYLFSGCMTAILSTRSPELQGPIVTFDATGVSWAQRWDPEVYKALKTKSPSEQSEVLKKQQKQIHTLLLGMADNIPGNSPLTVGLRGFLRGLKVDDVEFVLEYSTKRKPYAKVRGDAVTFL